MARLKVMFAKIVDMLLHWLRVDMHEMHMQGYSI